MSEMTGATCGAVSFGAFTRVLWEWWEGEKKSERAMQQGRAAMVASDEEIDGHVLCATLAQRPRSIVVPTLDHPRADSQLN